MMTVVQQNGGLGTYTQVGTDRAAGHHNDHLDFDEDGRMPGTELVPRVGQE